MQISKFFPVVCATALSVGFITARADDNPAQAAARAALEETTRNLDVQQVDKAAAKPKAKADQQKAAAELKAKKEADKKASEQAEAKAKADKAAAKVKAKADEQKAAAELRAKKEAEQKQLNKRRLRPKWIRLPPKQKRKWMNKRLPPN